MKRLFSIAAISIVLGGVCMANPVQTSAPVPSFTALTASIRTELETHGERVLGNDLYHWSTRLAKIEGCRAEFSVRLTNNLSESTVTVETVNFSLGALDPIATAIEQKHWVQLSCRNRESCVTSISVCSRRSKDGIIIDCTTPSEKRTNAFSLQLDSDAAAGERLKQDLLQAIDACSQPSRVSF
jgi:hypothetical protein